MPRVLLTLLITAPLLAPGYVVGDVMVFVPDLTLRLDLSGVTTAMPRPSGPRLCLQ